MSQEDLYPLYSGDRIDDQFRTTNWLAGAMMTVLRQYFATTDRIALEKGTLVWQDDAAASKVQIDVVDNLKFQEGTKFPKILVDVENQDFPGDVLGDQSGYQPNGTINYFTRDQGMFSIECWGLKKLEASAIADEVRYFLQGYRHVIARKYRFDKLRPKQLMKPVKYQQYAEYWIARLIVEFEFQDTWGTTKESLEASDFHLTLKGT